jgi:invasion protein IalB
MKLTAGILALTLSGPSPSPGDPVGVFHDWSKHCDEIEAAAPRSCYLAATATLPQSSETVLKAVIGPLTDDAKTLVLVLTAPLGVYLPAGLEIEVPKRLGRERHAYLSCDAKGCRTAIEMTRARRTAFEKAGEARVTIRDIQQRAIVIPLSLRGLKAGLKAL